LPKSLSNPHAPLDPKVLNSDEFLVTIFGANVPQRRNPLNQSQNRVNTWTWTAEE
jgi:hypothetical protein